MRSNEQIYRSLRPLLGLLLSVACGDGASTSDDPPSAAGSAGATSGGATNAGGTASAGRPNTAGGNGGKASNGGKTGASQAGSGGSSNAGRGGVGRGGASRGGAGATAGAPGTSGSTSASGGSAGEGSDGSSKAAAVARKLGREPNFLIGMGNDLDNDASKSGIFTLPESLDIHYYYLTQTWETWNEDGFFPVYRGEYDVSRGVTPMVSVYAMAGNGENNLSVLTDRGYMDPYWANMQLLFERYGNDLDEPAIVHLEPDFWAFAQQASAGDAAAQRAILHPDCSELPPDLTGMGRCIVKLARTLAPKVVLGFHASTWAATTPEAVADFLEDIGAGTADIVVIDMLDRDAGCFEAQAPECTRQGEFYWDETNRTSPNFHEHLAWAKSLESRLGVPILWWQVPFGVPSDTPGGSPGRYRDNRVKYLFEHVQEFVDAGGLGACFGTGAGNQTYIDSDGGQFANAVTRYYAAPVPLP